MLSILALTFALQLPGVQTGLARMASSYLEGMIDGRVVIGSIRLHPFNAVTVKDLAIIDSHPHPPKYGRAQLDTLAYVGKLSFTVSPTSFFRKGGIKLGRVDASNVDFSLAIEPGEEYSTNITRIFRIGESESDTPMTRDSLFSIRRLKAEKLRYRMVNFCDNPRFVEHGLNFEDMDLRASVRAHDLSFHGARMHGVVDYLTGVDKCGYGIVSARGTAAVGDGHVNVKNVHVVDNAGSDMYFSKVDMNYADDPNAWSHFVRRVEFDIDIEPSHLVFHTVGNYTGSVFYGCPLQVEVEKGNFKGPIAAFKVTDFNFHGTECGARGRVDGIMTGVATNNGMYLDAAVQDLQFTMEDVQKVLTDLGAHVSLEKLAPGTVFTANGEAKGYLSDLLAHLRVHSNVGSADLRAGMKNLTVSGKDLQLSASLDADRVNLGRILSSGKLGRGSFTATGSGTLGKNPVLTLNHMDISSLELLGYEYNDITVEGGLAGGDISARLHSLDPNATASLDAEINMKEKRGRVDLSLTEVDLAAINIDKRGGRSVVSLNLSGEQGHNPEEPAKVDITDIVIGAPDGTWALGDVQAQARLREGNLTFNVNSDMIDAKYDGSSNVQALVARVQDYSTKLYLPSYFRPSDAVQPPVSASLSVIVHDAEHLLAYILPGLSIGKETALNADITEDGKLIAYLRSPELSWKELSATDLSIAAGNLEGQLDCTIDAEHLQLRGFPLERASAGLSAIGDHIDFAVNYDDASVLGGGSELYLTADFARDERDSLCVEVNTLPSVFHIKGDVWELGASRIGLRSERLYAHGLRMASTDQSISIEGGVSKDASDTLMVKIQNLDLGIINSFAGSKFPTLEGIADGDLALLSPFPGEMGLTAGIGLLDLVVDGTRAGDIELTSDWDDDNKTVYVQLSNMLDGVRGLVAGGWLNSRTRAIDTNANFDGFDIAVGAPFLKNILPQLSGKLHGSINAGGTLDSPKLHSDGLRLEKARAKVSYTGVTYTLDGTMSVDDNIVRFNNIGITDDYQGAGVLTGTLALGDFSAPKFDAGLEMRRLQALDLKMDETAIMVYGNLAVSGSGHLSGPFSALHVDADIATAGPGNVNVPIPNSSSASSGELLTFVTPEDGTATQVKPVKTHSSRFTTHARVSVSPLVSANVEIDRDNGHVLTAKGNAYAVIDLNTAKSDFKLKGDYAIGEGKYLLNIPGMLSKEFDIMDGSAIKFNGPVSESTLDIHAKHRVKTSLGVLVADSTDVSTRRAVDCVLNIGGKLTSPEISFDIEVPDLDPSTQMDVDAALSTKDKVQKQFVALLLLGTFLPEENTGVVNGTNMLYANLGEIVAGQVNNILQKLDIPVDIGFGLQQDNIGTNIFDVAVSTQLFNNRVVVGGSLGNRRYSTSTSPAGDIVGDLDIELKLDQRGELRLKLFSHSADQYTSSLDFSQRNGLGMSYQKEFNDAADFIRSIFRPRRRRGEQGGQRPVGQGGRRPSEQDKEYKTIVVQ